MTEPVGGVATELRLNREQAAKLAAQAGARELQAALKAAARDLRDRIDQRVATESATPTTIEAMRVTLEQIEDVTRELAIRLGNATRSSVKSVAEAAGSNAYRYMRAAQRKYGANRPLPLTEAAMVARAVRGADSSLLRRLAMTERQRALEREGRRVDVDPMPPAFAVDRQTSVLERYSLQTVGQFEQALQVGLVTRQPWGEVRDRLVKESPFLQGAPAHWAERILRTETMGAYGRAQWEASREADRALGDMVKILAATFDNRTGWDSYQVHGQIRRVDEAFQWAGGYYQHPPNRPNDREVVVPHRVAWPIPPELYPRPDSEVVAAWVRDRRKGSPPPRPRRSTVPLEAFGR